MKAFFVSAWTKSVNGRIRPFTASVSEVRRIEHGRYTCRVDSSLFRKSKTFTSLWPDIAYNEACDAVRFSLDRRELILVNRKGREIEFVAPSLLDTGAGRVAKALSARFPATRFQGIAVASNGVEEKLDIRIGRVNRLKKAGSNRYRVTVFFSRYGQLGPVKGHSPDFVYTMAFQLIRGLFGGDGLMRRLKGKPVALQPQFAFRK